MKKSSSLNLETVAERVLNQGMKLKAARLFAKAGNHLRAGEIALSEDNENEAVLHLLTGALKKVDPLMLKVSALHAADFLASKHKHAEAEILYAHEGKFVRAAECAVQQNRKGAAARHYEAANRWTLAANYYESVGNLDAAMRILKQESTKLKLKGQTARNSSSKKTAYDIDFRRAQLLEKTGESLEAAKLFLNLSLPKKAAEILVRSGETTQATKAYAAAGLWKNAYDLLPRNPRINVETKAKINFEAGQYEMAGRLYESQGDLSSAAKAFQKADQMEKAASLWEKSKDYLLAAEAYDRAKNYTASARCWSAAGEYRNAALSYTKINRPRAAAENYLKGHHYLEAAEHFLKCKDKMAAQSALFQIPVTDANYPPSTFLLVPMLLDANQPKSALQRLQSLPSNTLSLPERAYLEGVSLEALGDDVAAESRYASLLAKHENYRDARKRYDALLEKTIVPEAQKAEDEPSGTIEVGMLIRDRYEVQEFIGKGGMGKVFKGYDRHLDDTVAIKVITKGESQGHGIREDRFLQEVRISLRVSHPNVVRVYGIDKWGEELYITMEYLEGESLENLVDSSSSTPLARILWVLKQITAGLEEAHTLGVIHRDLKPANIIVTKTRAKILDFGIAQAQDIDTRMTKTGLAMGSPRYMSPEQLQGEIIDARSDLYALGILAYALLAGREPFIGPVVSRILLDHIGTTPPNIQGFRPALPDSWVGFIERLLEKDPQDRFQNAAEVREALESLPQEELEGKT